MSKGIQIIFGIVYCLVPAYIIIYDLIYKIKLKTNYEKIDNINDEEKNDKTIKKFVTFGNIISILFSIVPCIICLLFFLISKKHFQK